MNGRAITGRRVVRMIHRAAGVFVNVCGIACVISFILFLVGLIYIWHSASLSPDAVHTIEMTSHGRTRFFAARQVWTWIAMGALWGASGVFAIVGREAVRVFEKLFPPVRWGYIPWKPPD